MIDKGLIRELYYPIEEYHENGDRQRKNRDRESNQGRWKDIRIEEICGIQSKSRCLRKQNRIILKTDPRGVCGTPEVLESDIMAIKPRREIETTENKCFHAEITIDYGIIPYGFNVLTNEQTQRTNFNHTCSNYDSWDENLSTENRLQNPTEKTPISIAEYLGKYLDMSPIRHVFESQYGKVEYHYRYPLDAMIKSSMIRRIKCMRSFQKLVNRFEIHQDDAESVGFESNGNGRYDIPDRRTFRHWENVRISNRTLVLAMDRCIFALKNELEKRGEVLGRRIGIDSTPLESLFNDDDAGYSGHYEKTGYKIHGAYDLDRNIPLAIIVTPMNEGDSPYFKVLLEKLHILGIKFEKVFADGAYDSYEHFALVHILYKAIFYTNLGINAVFNEKGTEENIQEEYNAFWRWKDFISLDKATIEDKLEYLMKHGKTEIVGAYFRNQLLQKWRKWEIEKSRGNPIPYNERNATEGYHGFVKKYLNLQIYFDYRGIRNVERRVRWTYLSVLGIALARAQNKITENLTQIAYFE